MNYKFSANVRQLCFQYFMSYICIIKKNNVNAFLFLFIFFIIKNYVYNASSRYFL